MVRMFNSLKPFPPPKEGARIRIIAPANFFEESTFAAAKSALEPFGFAVEACPHLFERHGQFAGPDELRAQSLEQAFADDSVDIVLCARGGYGSSRMVDLVDWDVVAANPKPFVGYSDNTALLCHLLFNVRQPVFHGPMGIDLRPGPGNDAVNVKGLVEALRCTHTDWPELAARASVICEGEVTAPLVGGNLTVLGCMAGTSTQFSADGAILLLEDVGEYIYRLDRVLVQLSRVGALRGVKGLILSDLIDIEDGNVPFGKTAQEMILTYFPDVPVISGFPAGHGPVKATMPLGIDISMSATRQGVNLEVCEAG